MFWPILHVIPWSFHPQNTSCFCGLLPLRTWHTIFKWISMSCRDRPKSGPRVPKSDLKAAKRDPGEAKSGLKAAKSGCLWLCLAVLGRARLCLGGWLCWAVLGYAWLCLAELSCAWLASENLKRIFPFACCTGFGQEGTFWVLLFDKA